MGGSELISILICSRNRRISLENLVKSLKSMDTARLFEIVVVEETDNLIPIDGVRYISHPVANRGIPYARNLALANASGQIIVFLDDDCHIHDGWLDNLLKPYADDSVVGVQGGVTVPSDTNAIGWAESILGFPGGGIRRVVQAEGEIQETREISTLNCAYRKWVIDEISGFDEHLILGREDYLLAKQACAYGRCLFVPKAMVEHKARSSLTKIWSWFVRRGRAEIGHLKTGKQQDTSLWDIVKGSFFTKLLILILSFFLFPDWILPLIILSIIAYMTTQYLRFYRAWQKCEVPSIWTLTLLPVVKLTMDMAMDIGRFRGIVFD